MKILIDLSKKNGVGNGLVMIALLVPFFKPASFQYIAPSIDTAYDILRVADALVICWLYIKRVILEKRNTLFVPILCMYEFVLISSTILNNQNIRIAFINAILVITFCMLIEYETIYNYKFFITILYWIGFILVLANFVVLQIYPNGIARTDYYYYPVNLWHIDNHMVNLLIFTSVVGLLYKNSRDKEMVVSHYILYFICAITTIQLWSATGVVAFLIYTMYMIFIYNRPWQKKFHSYWLFGGCIAVSLLLVFGRIQEVFSFIIRDILNKSIKLSGRTEMWDKAIILIRDRFLRGYGVPENHGFVYWHFKMYYTHNGILEVLIQGGILALFFSGMLYFIAARILYQYRNTRAAGLLAGAIASIMVTLWTEAYINEILIYGLMMLSCKVAEIYSNSLSGESTFRRVMLIK